MEIDIKSLESAIADAINHPSELLGVCLTVKEAQAVLSMLKEQEAVVRCKDCIHYRYYGLTEGTVSECTIDHCENPDKEWFCAAGKRR